MTIICLPYVTVTLALHALQKELFVIFFQDVTNLTPYMSDSCNDLFALCDLPQWVHAAAKRLVVARLLGHVQYQ